MTAIAESVAQITERLEKATPGDWRVSDHDVRTSAFVAAARYGHVCNAPVPHADWHDAEVNRNSQARKNIAFIAHAPADIAWLLSENARLQSRMGIAMKSLQRIANLIDSEQGEPLDDAIETAEKALVAIRSLHPTEKLDV